MFSMNFKSNGRRGNSLSRQQQPLPSVPPTQTIPIQPPLEKVEFVIGDNKEEEQRQQEEQQKQ